MLQPSPSRRAEASEVVSSLASLLARFETALFNNEVSTKGDAVCFEDEDWDEYRVNDALQHNLLADGTDLLRSVTTSSNFSSKSPSRQIPDAQDTSREWVSSPVVHFRASPGPEPISVPMEDNMRSQTVDSGYFSRPFDTIEDSGLVEPPTLSRRKRSLQSPLARPATDIKRKKGIANSPISQASTTITSNLPGSEDLGNSSLFPCLFYHHDPAKYGTKQWHSCMGPGWKIPRLK